MLCQCSAVQIDFSFANSFQRPFKKHCTSAYLWKCFSLIKENNIEKGKEGKIWRE